MNYPPFIHCVPLCVVLMMAACGGEGGSEPAENFGLPGMCSKSNSSGEFETSGMSSTTDMPHMASTSGMPEQPLMTLSLSPVAQDPTGQLLPHMAGLPNLGATCYANSVLKFLIHSADPQRLAQHLTASFAHGDAPHSEAAVNFVKLIESSYSENGPAPQDLLNFFASLQKLPAFSQRNAADELNFPLVGKQQDANVFLAKLSESFELGKLYGYSIVLQDLPNQFKTDEEYWTILQPATGQDSLQDIFDRTDAARWPVTPGKDLKQLTVRMENAVDDGQGLRMLGNWNFDFNQTVRLQAIDARSNRPLVLTLEPREVIEFRGIDNAGHYLAYIKDGQWFQHDDDRLKALDRMPAIENVRMINFAIIKIEVAS